MSARIVARRWSLFAAVAWSALWTGAGHAGAVAPVETTSMDGATYLNLNDLLRPLGGMKQFGTLLEVGHVRVGEREVTLLEGSPIVRAAARAWTLPRPVLKRDGVIWVPESFVPGVLDSLVAQNLTFTRGALLVDLVPGRLDLIRLVATGKERELVLTGSFPLGPSLRRGTESLILELQGCFTEVALDSSFVDIMLTGWHTRATRVGTTVEVPITDRVTGYEWREQSPERLRLVLGPADLGLKPFEKAPSGRRRDVRRIVLDPGHGGDDTGARLANGRMEKWANLELARLVAARLRASGYEVVFTRNEDRNLTPEQRAEFANEAKGDLFLSFQIEKADGDAQTDLECLVHHAVPDVKHPRVVGGFRFIPWRDAHRAHIAESEQAARCILGEVSAEGSTALRAPRRIPLRVMEGLTMPAVELQVSEKVLVDAAAHRWRERFAGAVARGIALYVGEARL